MAFPGRYVHVGLERPIYKSMSDNPQNAMSQHAHHHAPNHVNYHKAFAVGVALNAIYVVVEAGFGFAANSLALLADAGHNLSDVLGLLLAWAAHYLSQWKPTQRRTYGWRSTSILAALLNALILLIAVGGIAWEAIGRLFESTEVAAGTVMLVAGIGVLVNTATALLFLRGCKEDLNIKGAFLHMAADAGISVGVVLGGLSIIAFGWFWVDPALSLIIALVIFIGTWRLLKDSVNLILQAVPAGIDPTEVNKFLSNLPEVTDVHDLHIWAMSTAETALTAHLVTPDLHDNDAFLALTCGELHDRFGIEHATLQLEQGHHTSHCRLASPDVV